MSLTIGYLTSRKDPKFEWFRDSLARQCIEENYKPDLIVVCDHWFEERPCEFKFPLCETLHCEPKPNVWNGRYRLTKKEYFAPANVRNTILCNAPDGHLAYVDDLSVLMPGWLRAVRECVEAKEQIRLGSYIKANKIVVKEGRAISWDRTSIDSRWNQVKSDQSSVGGSWLFGCSVCFPIQSLLDINGWDERCDDTGIGSEDYITGIHLGNLGKYSFLYDRAMFTMESEEHHHDPNTADFLRCDEGHIGTPNSKSHSILNMAKAETWAPNYFGEGGIASVRQRVLKGEPFPMQQIPEHSWYTGKPLREL